VESMAGELPLAAHMNDHGLQHLLSSKFQVGADASASAGPVGRHASAGTDWKMDSEILTYSRSKGVFAGISLDGAVVEQDKDSMNEMLSEKRADAVRDYLVEQGVVTTSVSAKGFGNASPVASNDSAAGRQENRRVELLVSGEAIGSPANVTTGSLR
jgi:Las17-binding protein actin regulator/OmpA family